MTVEAQPASKAEESAQRADDQETRIHDALDEARRRARLRTGRGGR